MLPSDFSNEPLFFNRQSSQSAASSATSNSACPSAAFLTPQQQPLMLSAGIAKVAHLRFSLQLQHSKLLACELSLDLLALPPAWRASSAPASTWFQVLSASGRHFVQDAQNGQLHTIRPHLQFQQTSPEPVSSPSPIQFVSWDPSRPWRGSTHQSAHQGRPLLQGQLCQTVVPVSSVTRGVFFFFFGVQGSLGVWGWGSQPAHQYVVGQAAYAHGSSGLLPTTRWLNRIDLPFTPFADANKGNQSLRPWRPRSVAFSQVRSVPPSSDGGWTIPLKKRRKKRVAF